LGTVALLTALMSETPRTKIPDAELTDLLTSGTGLAPYTASKHALQCIAESLQRELKPFQIQVQTINPKAFLTGFNETMCESAFHWQDDSRNFIKRADIQNYLPFLGGGRTA
jgi:NAD(P)-dependent dehydrogenase (short-subunit alcohol dehydrogenase family)